MENKQTPVEWIFEKYCDELINYTEGKINNVQFGIRMEQWKSKAKEIERDEMKKFYDVGKFGGKVETYYEFDELYKEKYDTKRKS